MVGIGVVKPVLSPELIRRAVVDLLRRSSHATIEEITLKFVLFVRIG
jgi:hypothetical protein